MAAERKRVLVTVKTYPNPSKKYGELLLPCRGPAAMQQYRQASTPRLLRVQSAVFKLDRGEGGSVQEVCPSNVPECEKWVQMGLTFLPRLPIN